MRRVCAFLVLSSALSLCAGPVDFLSKPVLAGKALLAEDGFRIVEIAGTANFSPELRLPVQLVYDSTREKSGLFGYGWYSPQLESTAYYDKDGVLWTTPWGEKIKFFPKKDKKAPKDAIKIELYERAQKGRGFYAPYSEWEADTGRRDPSKSGDWTFTGKRGKSGWRFVYRAGLLQSVTAPSGRKLDFLYEKKQLSSVVQDDVKFIELVRIGNVVTALRINGVESRFAYRTIALKILPKTESGSMISADRAALVSYRRGNLDPVLFSYDEYGFLCGTVQGERTDTFTVQHQTLEQRHRETLSKKNSKIKYSGPVNGRILSDGQYKYSYGSTQPGSVTLTDKLRRKAVYDLNRQTGVFKLTEFSGKSYTIYYFMRHDVAYLGKVRKIVDGRGRDVINYRYDKLSGNVIRVRDMIGNDLNFEYGENGKVSLVTRRGAEQNAAAPVRAMTYDREDNLASVSTLYPNGTPAVTTSFVYDDYRQPVSVGNGQKQFRISYNRSGYPVSVTDAFGGIVRREYDKYNRLTGMTDIHGVQTVYTYTPAGLISQIRRGDGKYFTSLAVKYDGGGRPASYTDQQGRTKRFERDAFGRVVRELFPDDTQVAYTYDKIGQLTSVLDQNSHTISFGWDKFGLKSRRTPAGQLTDYVRDKYGLVDKVLSRWQGKPGRSLQYTRDAYDRIVKVDYGSGEIEERRYDTWGRPVFIRRGDKTATFRYDYFGRLIRRTDGDMTVSYTYNRYGQRTGMVTKKNGLTFTEKKTYDRYGRLTGISANGKDVKYLYNGRNQLAAQIVNNIPIEFTWTKYGQLESKTLGSKVKPIATLQYLYASDGMISGRIVDGKFQMYTYDRRGQLLQVADKGGVVSEKYQYDPAGNILSKTVDGRTTTYTYDKANQLVSSTCDGKVTHYGYDAAGRLIKEGDKTYTYGWLDKVLRVDEAGKTVASFDYHMDGQLAKAVHDGKEEEFLWDGLALIHRGGTDFINEPYVTGGNPISSSKDGVMFNDMLGSTLNIGGRSVKMTAFGESADAQAMYTGKPFIGELGYAFLFRNYRPDKGKWLTADPLGYPDGWNQLAYVNNWPIETTDIFGGADAGLAKIIFTTNKGREISVKISSATEIIQLIGIIDSLSGEKIKQFIIRGHGTEDGQMVIGDTIFDNSQYNLDNHVGLQNSFVSNLIRQNFSVDADIYVQSCYQGDSNGMAWGFKTILPNSTVTAATGKITIPLGWLDLPPFIGVYALTGSHWVKE